MSRELDLLAKEFSKTPVTIMRTEVNLYQTNIHSATSVFLKKVEQECKKQKQSTFTLIATLPAKK
jgi:hypothetical protein